MNWGMKDEWVVEESLHGFGVQRCERTGQGNLEGLCELELWMEVDLGRWSVRSWPGEQWGKSNVGGVVRLGRAMERE